MTKNKGTEKKMGGPFLSAAIICEAVMQDAANKMSAFGISDGLVAYLSKDAPANIPSEENPAIIQLNMLIIIRSGDSPGKHMMKISALAPDGKRTTVHEQELILTDPPHGGFQLKIVAQVSLSSNGIYLFDVILDNKRITRMPYNVEFKRLP